MVIANKYAKPLADLGAAVTPTEWAKYVLQTFDPVKQKLLATYRTEDEDSVFLTVIDRASGTIQHAGEVITVEMDLDPSKPETKTLLGPLAGAIQPGDENNPADAIYPAGIFDVASKGGSRLDVGAKVD